MPCICLNCKKDDIINGTLIAKCSCCSSDLGITSNIQIVNDNKDLICEKCVLEHYINCPICSKLHKKTDIKEIVLHNGEKVSLCSPCLTANYRNCTHCSKYFDSNNVQTYKDVAYCMTCFGNFFQKCTHCGSIHEKGKIIRKIWGGKIACDTCFGLVGPIGPHSAKPEIELVGRAPHFYGVELEVELKSQRKEERGFMAEAVANLFDNFIIVKEDGSLKTGFEICTKPASLDEHMVRWNKFFDNLPHGLLSYDSGRCGLHVHCSKKPLTLLTIAKMVVFVNNPQNQIYIEKIAGRRSNEYSCYKPKKIGSVLSQYRGTENRERYEALNLTNRDTVEFRIFRGTLKRESFLKALQFCDALIHFCLSGSHSITYCKDWNNFVSYVGLRTKDYPHLNAFIQAKFLKTETKLTKQFGFSKDIENDPQL